MTIPEHQLQTACPYCKRDNELHTGMDEHGPEAGDWSMCWVCRNVAVFMETPEGLVLRRATRLEQQEINQDPRCKSAREKALTIGQLADALRAWRKQD